MYARYFTCQACGMTFPGEGLLHKHMSNSCLNRPSHHYQTYQTLTAVALDQQASRKYTELVDTYNRHSSEYSRERHQLYRDKQRIEGEIKALQRVKAQRRDAENIRKLSQVAKQQNLFAIELLKLRSATDSDGNPLLLDKEDEILLNEIIDVRRKYLAEGGGNVETLAHMAGLEKLVLEKARRQNAERKRNNEKKLQEERKITIEKKGQNERKDTEDEQTMEMSRHMKKLEQDNERLMKEFHRLQDMSSAFLQHQQTLMLQRDMLDRLEKGRPNQPAIAEPIPRPLPAELYHQPPQPPVKEIDLRKYDNEFERLRAKLEEVEGRLASLTIQPLPQTSLTRSEERLPVSPPGELRLTDGFPEDRIELPNPVTSLTLSRDESPQHLADTGFRIYFDYVRRLTRDFQLIKLSYSLYIADTPMAEPTMLEVVNPNPRSSGLEYVFMLDAKQDVPNVNPDPDLCLLLQLTARDMQGKDSQVAWNKISLYTGDDWSDLQEGKWKISLRRPPVFVHSTKAERKMMRNYTQIDVYIRIQRGVGEDLQTMTNSQKLEDSINYKYLVS